MKKKWIVLVGLVAVLGIAGVWAGTRSTLREQASAAIANQQYDKALVLLNQIAANEKDPKALESIDADIQSCKSHLNFAGPTVAAAGDGAPVIPAANITPNMVGPQQTKTVVAAAKTTAVIIDPITGNPRVPHDVAKAGQTLSMAITELGNFAFDPLMDVTVPDDVLALDGVKVSLPGYINLWDQSEFLTDFALTPSLGNCCYGAPAGVQHTIICHAAANKHFEFTPEQVIITGKLTVKPLRENDYTHTVFQLQIESIKPVE